MRQVNASETIQLIALITNPYTTETKKQSLSHKDEGIYFIYFSWIITIIIIKGDLFFLDYGVGKSKRKQKEDEKKKNDNFKVSSSTYINTISTYINIIINNITNRNNDHYIECIGCWAEIDK